MPQRALAGQRPLGLAGRDMESCEVEESIGRLEHGVFS